MRIAFTLAGIVISGFAGLYAYVLDAQNVPVSDFGFCHALWIALILCAAAMFILAILEGES